jgi:stalled ribosome rescue protein Dom34
MITHPHAAVWLDHHEARVIHVQLDHFDEESIRSPKQHIHRHPKGGTAEHNHPDDLHHFFREVARALDDSGEVLVVGPSTAKLQFLRYLHKHDPALESRIVGVETAAHPTDGQLVAHAKQYFKVSDPRVR